MLRGNRYTCTYIYRKTNKQTIATYTQISYSYKIWSANNREKDDEIDSL